MTTAPWAIFVGILVLVFLFLFFKKEALNCSGQYTFSTGVWAPFVFTCNGQKCTGTDSRITPNAPITDVIRSFSPNSGDALTIVNNTAPQTQYFLIKNCTGKTLYTYSNGTLVYTILNNQAFPEGVNNADPRSYTFSHTLV
jgi:hypothetical protein